jgi:hypothetical protein
MNYDHYINDTIQRPHSLSSMAQGPISTETVTIFFIGNPENTTNSGLHPVAASWLSFNTAKHLQPPWHLWIGIATVYLPVKTHSIGTPGHSITHHGM